MVPMHKPSATLGVDGMFCLTDVMFVTECECDYVNDVGSGEGNGAKTRKTLSLNVV